MKRFLVAAAAAFTIAAPALAQTQLEGLSADQLTIVTHPAKGGASLTVTSEAFEAGEYIPNVHSAYSENVSPQLSWTAGPAGTQSYIVIMEDPDLGEGRPPFLHWIIGDLSPGTTSLPRGVTTSSEGAFQTGVRPNQHVYFGPRPPAGAHTYTFQVFALDKRLGLADGARLPEVKAAMEGHVLASGALQGLYAAPTP